MSTSSSRNESHSAPQRCDYVGSASRIKFQMSVMASGKNKVDWRVRKVSNEVKVMQYIQTTRRKHQPIGDISGVHCSAKASGVTIRNL